MYGSEKVKQYRIGSGQRVCEGWSCATHKYPWYGSVSFDVENLHSNN